MKILSFLILPVLWAIMGAAAPSSSHEEAQPPTVDLRDFAPDTPGLPWLLQAKPEYSPDPGQLNFRAGPTHLIANFDDDPDQELIVASHDYIVLKKFRNGQLLIQNQCNFPHSASTPDDLGTGFSLAGPFDLDGDGRLEVAVWGCGTDQSSWDFFIVDIASFAIVNSFTLNGFPERKPDGLWDGHFCVIGEMPGVLKDADRKALIINVSVEQDCYGRGILAVDPYTGDVIWHFESGLEPFHPRSFVGDFDQDGRHEVVFIGRGPDNLDGELVGRYSDDQTRLLVLDDRGREIWSRQLASGCSVAEIALGDVDGNAGPEIVTLARVVSEPGCRLQVWGLQGELMAGEELPVSPLSVGLLPRPGSSVSDIVFDSRDMTLRMIRFENGRLHMLRKALFPNLVSLAAIFPLGKDNDFHILTLDRSGRALLLNNRLQAVAAASDLVFRGSRTLEFMSTPDGPLLIRAGRGSASYSVLPNPDALPTNFLARFLVTRPLWLWLVMLLALCTGIIWRRLRTQHRREIEARAVIPGDRDHLREARLHLLEDLELSGHGAIAPLRSLRRLLWLLDALKTGIEFNEEMSSRFREIWQDCHQDDLPRLLVILDRARAAQLDHDLIDGATSALQKIQLHLAGFRKLDFALHALESARDDLHENGDIAESSLQELRNQVAGLFTADLVKVVNKVLRANAREIEAAGVAVQVGQMAAAQAGGGGDQIPQPAGAPLCRMDPTELGFILDNLVGNAVLAMSGSATRQLQVGWQPVNGLIKVEVRDTGVGVADEDLDRILESPFSTREGGGLGLPKSVRILRKYGGSLSIKSSAPGRGTTFQLLIPLARRQS